MKLSISNIGRFGKQAVIDIEGITVLAGANGTGKSTIGKALYCLFDTFFDYEEQIIKERSRSIFNILRYANSANPSSRTSRIKYEDCVELAQVSKNGDIGDYIDEWMENNLGHLSDGIDLEEIRTRIIRALSASDRDVIEAMLSKRFYAEFRDQIRHVNYPGVPADIDLKIKDDHIRVNISSNNNITIINHKNLLKRIVYIDDPNILDELEMGAYLSLPYHHRSNLIDKLRLQGDKGNTAVDDVILDERIRKIEGFLDKTNVGRIVYSSDAGYRYKEEDLNESISIGNMSMGLKSYLILKELLYKGYIEDNGIVILDEPEIHLHPEWMRLYAELIVSMQKEFNLNVLLSTHSSDFLSFIELFSIKYGTKERCRYYLTSIDKDAPNYSDIFEVTDDVDLIYNKLGKPFIEASEEIDNLNETKGD